MAKLTAKDRASLPSSDFAVPSRKPGSGSYPVPDASHARNALSRVSQFGTASEKSKVRAKVRSRFPGVGKGTQKPTKD